MSKADKMFEELGYEKEEEISYCKTIDSGVYEYISFDDNFTQYRKTRQKGWDSTYVDIYLEEHLAIHEKMKESGCIEKGETK